MHTMHRVHKAIIKTLTHVDNISYVVLLTIMSYPKCNISVVNSNLALELKIYISIKIITNRLSGYRKK